MNNITNVYNINKLTNYTFLIALYRQYNSLTFMYWLYLKIIVIKKVTIIYIWEIIQIIFKLLE